MNNEMFPEICIIPKNPAYENKESFRIALQERLFFCHAKKKCRGWKFSDFLRDNKIKDYALYAFTDFTEIFLEEIINDPFSILPKVLCDRNLNQNRFMKFPQFTKCSFDELIELYKNMNIDKIFVMSAVNENEIYAELLSHQVNIDDIISIVSILTF